MFICTLKASNIKFFAVVISAVALLVTLVAITGGGAADALEASAAPDAEKISFENVRSNDDRIAFLAQFGWEVEAEPVSETKLKLPAEFDDIMNEYNEIQRSQGLDLSKYKGNEVVRYSYAVTNYPGYDGEVLANIIVAKSRVVAGDVCSADPDGFIGSLERPAETESSTAESEAAVTSDIIESTAAAAGESVSDSDESAETQIVGDDVGTAVPEGSTELADTACPE